MIWSAEQQRLLGAMGFQLMTRVTSAVARPVATGSNAADFPELRQALRRAAGDRDIEGLVEDLERLRREPALKRALWSRLRILRRSQ